MIRRCYSSDNEALFEIINDSAQAYKGVIPADRWHEPYMSREELAGEIASGVVFWGYQAGDGLIGVMGLQNIQDVTLIRHAYVRNRYRNKGIGSKLLAYLKTQTDRPILMGTWADAGWAVRFYQKHGFKLVTPDDKTRLLKKYWSIPERQIETSVILADENWFKMNVAVNFNKGEKVDTSESLRSFIKEITGASDLDVKWGICQTYRDKIWVINVSEITEQYIEGGYCYVNLPEYDVKLVIPLEISVCPQYYIVRPPRDKKFLVKAHLYAIRVWWI